MIDPVKLATLRRHATGLWHEFKGLLLFLLLMVMFRSAVADWSDVPTGSMKPTIIEGDRIFVNKMAYDLRVPLTHHSLVRLAEPQRGDIIIFDSAVSELRLVKRVIGVPGDVVQVRGDIVSVNGQQLGYESTGRALINEQGGVAEDLRESIHPNAVDAEREYTVRMRQGGRLSDFGPVRVPNDAFFVLGDNRDNSADSRVIGFVPRDEIVGRSSSVVLSLDYENAYLPRAERFFHSL